MVPHFHRLPSCVITQVTAEGLVPSRQVVVLQVQPQVLEALRAKFAAEELRIGMDPPDVNEKIKNAAGSVLAQLALRCIECR